MATHMKMATGFTFPNVREGVDQDQLDDFNAWLVSKGISPVVPGDPNPIYNDLFGFQSDSICRVTRGSQMNALADVGPITNTDWLPHESTEMFMACSGEWNELPLYWEIPARDDPVPEDLPYRTYVDEFGNDQIHTWETWGGSGKHPIYERGGKLYRSTAVNNAIGWLATTLPFLNDQIKLPWFTNTEFIEMAQAEPNPAGGEGGEGGEGGKRNR